MIPVPVSGANRQRFNTLPSRSRTDKCTIAILDMLDFNPAPGHGHL
jgi:hypothetical protein